MAFKTIVSGQHYKDHFKGGRDETRRDADTLYSVNYKHTESSRERHRPETRTITGHLIKGYFYHSGSIRKTKTTELKGIKFNLRTSNRI